MNIVYVGAPSLISLKTNQSIAVVCTGTALVEVVSGLGLVAGSTIGSVHGSMSYGPYSAAGVVRITATGRDASYEVYDGVNGVAVTKYTNPTTSLDELSPTDKLVMGISGYARADLIDIVQSYERCKNNNARTNTLPSCNVVYGTGLAYGSLTSGQNALFASSSALQTAAPAASNTNKGAFVGTAGNYSVYRSDGSSWVLQTNMVGYVNTTGITIPAGYTNRGVLAASFANVAPDQGLTSLANSLQPPFRLYGAMPYQTGGSVGTLNGVASTALKPCCLYEYTGGARTQAPLNRMVYVTDEPVIYIGTQGDGATHIINVDDGTGNKRVVDSTITAVSGQPSNSGRISYTTRADGGGWQFPMILDFSSAGGRKLRIIEQIIINDTHTSAVAIRDSSSFYTPPPSPFVLWLADSLGGTVSLGIPCDSYTAVMQDYLGVRDIFQSSEGGTGFVNKGPGNNYRTHLMKLQALASCRFTKAPSFIGIQVSGNDNTYAGTNPNEYKAAVTDCLNYALTTWPGVPILLTGTMGISNRSTNAPDSTTQSRNTETLAFEAATAIGSRWIKTIPTQTDVQPWVSGSGRIGAEVGDGNADFKFNSADPTHYSKEGHQIDGARMAGAVAAALRTFIAGEA